MSLSKKEWAEIARLRDERTREISARRNAAYVWVQKAIKCGVLPPAKDCVCVDCGKPALVYDHRDYTLPDFVEPVCKSCDALRGPGFPYDAHPTKKDVWIKRQSVPFQKFNDAEIVKDRESGMTWRDLSEKYGLSVSQLKRAVSAPRANRHDGDYMPLVETYTPIPLSALKMTKKATKRAYKQKTPISATEAKKRNEEMRKLYARGDTMQYLADKYSISRQRIQQILSEQFGMGRRDGGMHVRERRRG